MRLKPIGAGFMAVLALATAFAGTAFAGGDRVYADDFGNLVVHSRSGYKSITIGQGYRAAELAGTRPAPRIVYVEEDAPVPYECWKPAVLLKGRSYMYGLEDGELPDLPGKWCGLPERAAPGVALRRVQP
jgi:hypothetical protein